jgi:alkylation response protein AidB-like acyl-CoA dehydrogenase
MISFDPSEDQRMMLDAARGLAKTLRTRMRELETARAVPEDLQKTVLEMGLASIAIPEACGGAGLGLATAVLLEQELAVGDAAAAFGFRGPGAFGLAAVELGTPEQAARAMGYLEGGFGAVAWGERKPNKDRPGLCTTATLSNGHYLLNGEKSYVLNADRANAFIVFAQVDESLGWGGLGAFVVPRHATGVAQEPREVSLGLDVASVSGLTLTNVSIPESARLLGNGDFDRATLRFFVKNALIVGLSRAAVDVTRDYTEVRKAFGKPIAHFQAVAFNVADRAMDAASAASMVQRAAWMWDAGVPEKEALTASAYAISHALSGAMRCGDDAVQLHGGAGFMRDYPVEKMMRDAKQLQLCGMPSGCADQLAAALETGRPLDLGLVLPTAESQSALV